jgi:hypothetical protein
MLETTARPGPALSATSDAPQPVASEPEAPPAQTTEPVVGDEASPEPTQETKPEPKEDKTDPAVKAAITKERNRRREAEERAAKSDERIAQLAAALEAATKKPEPKPLDRPSREQFTDPDAYDEALVEYASQKAAEKAIAEERQRAAQETKARQQEKTASDFRSQIETFKADHPDFDEVFTEDLPISPAMTDAIVSSDNAAQISYWLGQNPDEAKRINDLPPVKAIYEIGRIAAQLAAPPPVQRSAPKPAPIKPVGQRTGTGAKDPAEMSTEEYAAYRNAQIRGANGHAVTH